MTAVLCLGEVVVDWISTAEGGATEHKVFERHLAGVPANVAVALARQNVSSAMIGRVGDDALGHWAREELKAEKVDVSSLAVDAAANTRTAYVARKLDGERETLGVMRVGCADSRLALEEIKSEQFEGASALYFGSTALSSAPVSLATAKAIALAKQHNLLVVSDANIWPAMWASDEECRAAILRCLKDIDLLKVNLAELEFLTGSQSLTSAVELRARLDVPVIVVTCGEQGSFVCAASGTANVAACKVKSVEAAGAGDGLVAAVIASLLPHLSANESRQLQLSQLPIDVLVQAVRRGNAAGALVCSRLGALSAMPTAGEIDQLLLQSLGEKEALRSL